jgi:hypothetical protein
LPAELVGVEGKVIIVRNNSEQEILEEKRLKSVFGRRGRVHTITGTDNISKQ